MVDGTLLGISIFHVVMGTIFWLWAGYNTHKSGLVDSGLFIFALMVATGSVGISNVVNDITKGEYLYQVHLDLLLSTHIILFLLHILGLAFNYLKLKQAREKAEKGLTVELGPEGPKTMAEKREAFFGHEPNVKRKLCAFAILALIWFALGMTFYQLLL